MECPGCGEIISDTETICPFCFKTITRQYILNNKIINGKKVETIESGIGKESPNESERIYKLEREIFIQQGLLEQQRKKIKFLYFYIFILPPLILIINLLLV